MNQTFRIAEERDEPLLEEREKTIAGPLAPPPRRGWRSPAALDRMDERTGRKPAAIPSAAIEVGDVGHAFGRFQALEGVSFRIEPGQIACLLGHSGCGKTTLLRIIAGVEEPTSGRVLLSGRLVTGAGAFVEPENRNVGLLFQDYALFPHLTVLENVMFGLRERRLERRAIATEALERVGLVHLSRSYPETLSGGEQQRVALARAIAPRPTVILLDEPFSNLDRRLRDRIRDETIEVLRTDGLTAVIVTHDPQEALPVADKVLLMRAGRLVQTGSAEDMYSRPNSLFAARFFADWNEVEGICLEGRVATRLGTFAVRSVPNGTKSVVCIRPEGLRLSAAGSVRARVLRRSFLGPATLFELAVESMPERLRARAESSLAVRVGDEVGIEIDPDSVLVLKADEHDLNDRPPEAAEQ